jgi:hypothetical protein
VCDCFYYNVSHYTFFSHFIHLHTQPTLPHSHFRFLIPCVPSAWLLLL